MGRITTTLTLFFIIFNVWAGILMSTGVAPMIGMDAEVGADRQIESTTNDARNVSTGTGLGSTLFGMYNVLSSGAADIFDLMFPGLVMLQRAGVPDYLTKLMGPLFVAIFATDMLSFLRGFDL
jgi:hypothetical protein